MSTEQSYRTQGENDTPVLARLTDYVDLFATSTPLAEAAVSGDERLTYAELQRRVDLWARALLGSDVNKGDRVAMLCTSRTEFWVCFLATVRVGAIWVGLNPKYTVDECLYVLEDAAPRVLFVLADFEGPTAGNLLPTLRSDVQATDSIESIVSIGGSLTTATDLSAFLQRGGSVSQAALNIASDAVVTQNPAAIVYTSGSSGSPKGAILSHHGLCFGATVQVSHFNVAAPSVVVNFPINHVSCLADVCATTLVKGGKLVFQERFDAAETLAAVESERCTIWGGVPTMLQLQLAHANFPATDLSSVELILWGGAAMPVESLLALRKLGPRLLTAYGMTETSCHTTYTDSDAGLEVLAETVGRPDPRCPCRIVSDTGAPCAVDEPGEIQFRGDYLMLGYWNRAEATREATTVDGWFRTGDIGQWREDGNIRLVARRTDMFKSGGYNVYPREIETVLEQMPGVELAAVVGVSDPLYQEVGHAFMQLHAGIERTEAEFQAWCRASLANYKVPKRFHVLDELPLLPVGKVDKQALRRAATGHFTEEQV